MFTHAVSLLLAAAAAFFSATGSTSAQMVINTNDSGAGSLRQAVIGCCAGRNYLQFGAGAHTITLSTEIAINKSLTITGPDNGALTVSGGDVTQSFTSPARFVALSNMTIANGTTNGFPGGGAIYNEGTLTVTNSTFSNNHASQAFQMARCHR